MKKKSVLWIGGLFLVISLARGAGAVVPPSTTDEMEDPGASNAATTAVSSPSIRAVVVKLDQDERHLAEDLQKLKEDEKELKQLKEKDDGHSLY